MKSPTLPTLEQVAADPGVLDAVPVSIQLALYRQAAVVEAALRARLITANGPGGGPIAAADRDGVVGIGEAASMLSTTKDTLYRKWRGLPFAYKDALDGRIKFHRAALAKHIGRTLSDCL
jgi:hypothetical protein